MMRVMAGVAAWAGGTAIAVCVAWFGANVVVRDAGVRSGMPVVNAAVLPPSPAPSTAVTPPPAPSPGTGLGGTGSPGTDSAGAGSAGTGSPSPSAVTTGSSGVPAGGTGTSSVQVTPSAPGAAAGSTSAAPAGAGSSSTSAGIRAYTLAGGRVTLNVTATSVELVTAVPDDGYSVQTWSGTDWLRVDFSSGAQVSSLIASWYEQTPAITVTN